MVRQTYNSVNSDFDNCFCKIFRWSFGILLWEIFSLGEEPYPGLGNKGVIRCLIEDTIMGPPERCPERVYELMTKCWKKDPAERPSFPVVVSTVEYIFQYRAYQSVSYHSYIKLTPVAIFDRLKQHLML